MGNWRLRVPALLTALLLSVGPGCSSGSGSGSGAPGSAVGSAAAAGHETSTHATTAGGVRYALHLPADMAAKPSWPLMVFLHGAGERGDDLAKVKLHGPPMHAEAGKVFPFILASPQVDSGERWEPERVLEVLTEVSARYPVDPARVYLTGLSMGGYGTWATAIAYPERFAAIAPVCGGGDPGDVGRIKGLPVWVFHGAKDDVVPLSESQEMVDALKAAGGDVKLTIYPEADHDSWTETYANPMFYDWLLSHRRGT